MFRARRSYAKPTADQPGIRRAIVNRTVGVIALFLAVFLLDACGLVGGGDATPIPRTPRPIPTPTSTAIAENTPEPTPAPTSTPAPNLSRVEVERLVSTGIVRCADQIAVGSAASEDEVLENEIRLVLASSYSPITKSWLIEGSNTDPALTFGIWEVSDSTREVFPLDGIARSIATPELICALPISTLASSPSPPRFLAPTPTPAPAPTPTPSPLVASAEEAALRVWTSVYNCYDHFPDSASFIAFQSSRMNWTVEGRSSITHYGLWEVSALSGAITPRDELATLAQERCTTNATLPAVVSAEQAQLRVWIAVYDCYPLPVQGTSGIPRPAEDVFAAYQESLQRWVVEGKDVTTVLVEVVEDEQGVTNTFTEEQTFIVYYGLWKVDTETGEITALDSTARDIQKLGCFNPL